MFPRGVTHPLPQVVYHVEGLEQDARLPEVKLNPLLHLVSQDVLKEGKQKSILLTIHLSLNAVSDPQLTSATLTMKRSRLRLEVLAGG